MRFLCLTLMFVHFVLFAGQTFGIRSMGRPDQVFTSNDVWNLQPFIWCIADVGASTNYPDGAATNALNGQKLRFWKNIMRSPSTNSFRTSGTSGPIYETEKLNGHSILTFDFSRSAYAMAASILDMTNSQPMTLICVLYTTNKASLGYSTGTLLSVNRTNVGCQLGSDDGSFITSTWTGSTQKDQKFAKRFDDKWHIISTIFAGTNGYHTMVRYGLGSARLYLGYNADMYGGGTSGLSGFVVLGYRGWTVNNYWNGCVAEIIYVSRMLNEAELSGVEFYLKRKYAL